MNRTPITTRTIDLGYEQLLTFEGCAGTRVRVLYGAMWLTEEGDLRDIFVRCGDEVTLSSPGRSVIEGLGAARVQVIERAGPSRIRQALRALPRIWERVRSRRPWRDAFARSMLMVLAAAVSVALLHVAVPGPLARHDPTLTVQSPSRPAGAVDETLAAAGRAGTAFLAVN